MNRKLHNTFHALTASGAILALGLAIATPVAPPQGLSMHLANAGSQSRAANPAANLDKEELDAVLARVANSLQQAERAAQAARAAAESMSDDHRASSRNRRGRHSLVMPYFSFAPRG